MRGMRGLTTALMVCALAGFAFAQEEEEEEEEVLVEEGAPEAAAGPEDAAVDALKGKLIEAALKDGPTEATRDLFLEYALACAKQASSRNQGEALSEDFWSWLESRKRLRDELLVGLHAREYDVRFMRCLDELRRKFGTAVDERSQLALAFTFVWGRLDQEGDIAGRFRRYYRDRTPATRDESFQYYLDNEKQMRVSLKKTPWQVLAFVADNDVPIEERKWALARYRKWPPEKFGGLFGQVPYDFFVRRIAGHPRTLANLATYGGAGNERTYFASRVLKSTGVPSFVDLGEIGTLRHIWIGVVVTRPRTKRIVYFGRGEGGSAFYVASAENPLTGSSTRDYLLEIALDGASTSPEPLQQAQVGCYVWKMLDEDRRVGARSLLEKSVELSPYCLDGWLALAGLCASPQISNKESERIFNRCVRKLHPFPDLTCSILETIVLGRQEVKAVADIDKLVKDMVVFQGVEKVYEQAKRPDLAAKAAIFRGDYLQTIDCRERARQIYVEVAEKYAKREYGFVEAYDRVIALLPGDKNRPARVDFMLKMAGKVPRYSYRGNVYTVNAAFRHVVTALVRELEALGMEKEAEAWREKLRL